MNEDLIIMAIQVKRVGEYIFLGTLLSKWSEQTKEIKDRLCLEQLYQVKESFM